VTFALVILLFLTLLMYTATATKGAVATIAVSLAYVVVSLAALAASLRTGGFL
jgi:hypothetical protein